MARVHPSAEVAPPAAYAVPPHQQQPPPAPVQHQQQQQQVPVQSLNQTAEFFLSNYRLGKTLGIGSFGKVRCQAGAAPLGARALRMHCTRIAHALRWRAYASVHAHKHAHVVGVGLGGGGVWGRGQGVRGHGNTRMHRHKHAQQRRVVGAASSDATRPQVHPQPCSPHIAVATLTSVYVPAHVP